MPESRAGNDKLDSWKEIATYLGRDVRTAIRWEKDRGLPVHRLPGGGRRQPVFAYKGELDSWLKEGPIPVPMTGSQKETVTTRGKTTASLRWPLRIRRIWVYFLTLAAISAVAGGSWLTFSHWGLQISVPVKITFTANAIHAFDAEGHSLWTHSLSRSIPPEYLKQTERLNKLVRIADLNGRGEGDVLVTVPFHLGLNPTDLIAMEVDCFSSQGRLLWSYTPQEKLRFGNYELNGPWIVHDIFISSASKPMIWVDVVHYRWGNSLVVQLDSSTGNGTLRLVNTGVIYKLNEVQISGKPYLLAGGFNNEYEGGSLAIMDERRPFAASPQTVGTRHQCTTCPAGVPDYYLVFPRSEINRLRNVWENFVREVDVRGDEISVGKAEVEAGPGDEALGPPIFTYYSFHAGKPTQSFSLRFDSRYDLLHRKLEEQRQLNHSLDRCTERLHPEPIRLWTPSDGWTQIALRAVRSVE